MSDSEAQSVQDAIDQQARDQHEAQAEEDNQEREYAIEDGMGTERYKAFGGLRDTYQDLAGSIAQRQRIVDDMVKRPDGKPADEVELGIAAELKPASDLLEGLKNKAATLIESIKTEAEEEIDEGTAPVDGELAELGQVLGKINVVLKGKPTEG